MNIKPLADRIVIKPIEQEEVVVGGIVIPDTAKRNPKPARLLQSVLDVKPMMELSFLLKLK